MKKYWALVMIFTVLCLTLMPLTVGAYNGGLIQGLTVYRYSTLPVAGDTSGTAVTKITDNSLSTSDDSQNKYYTVTLPATKSIDRVFSAVSGNNGDSIRFYDSNKTLLGTETFTSTSGGQTVNLSQTYNNVKYITFGAITAVSVFYEIDVYGTQLADTTPPPVPLIGSAVAHNGSTDINWGTVSAPDLLGYNVYVDSVKVTSTPITGTSYTATGLSNNVVHSFTVTSVDQSNNESLRSDPVTSIYDTISPLAPIGLVLNPTAQGQVQLDWSDNTEPDLAGYNVYQDSAKKNTSLVQVSQYSISGLLDNVTYSFAVTALDTSGNESVKSSSVSYIFDTNAPEEPTGLTGTSTHSSVNLTWSASTDPDVIGYDVYQAGVKINNATVLGTSFLVNGLTPLTDYKFTVRAIDNAGNRSINSNELLIKTKAEPITPPNTPTGLAVKVLSGAISLTWDNAVNATSYNIFLDGVKVNVDPVQSTNYVITGVENGISYNVQISAENTAGESAKTAPMNVTPSDKALPYITYTYSLKDVADGVAGWFSGYWRILAFVISIPLTFLVAQRIKALLI